MSEIVTRQADGITILDIPKSLLNLPKRSEDRGELNRVITEMLDAGHNKIVLDLSPVTGYCTPAGLSELIWALKTMHQGKGQLKLSNVPPSVRAGLELSRTSSKSSTSTTTKRAPFNPSNPPDLLPLRLLQSAALCRFVSAGQIFCRSSSRVAIWPKFSSNIAGTRKGLILQPDLRSVFAQFTGSEIRCKDAEAQAIPS